MQRYKTTIFLEFWYLKKLKMWFYPFKKICMKKPLGFARVHENIIFFYVLKWGNVFWIFLDLFWNFREKIKYFNTRSVSYNVSLWLDIRQNYWKNMWRTQMISKWSLKFFRIFWLFIRLVWLNIKIKTN
jgi:hypothetical protein